MFKVTISQKGQISLPAILRKRFCLKKGDKLLVEEKDGSIVMRPLPEHPLLSLRGKYSSKDNKKLTTLLREERDLDRKRER